MPLYSIVLLDADNTLFDFDAAEHKALTYVLRTRGYTPDQETIQTYLDINAALWDLLAKGKINLEHLLTERFRQFQAAVGGRHDPAAFNADYLNALSVNGDLLPGAVELCAALQEGGCRLAIVTNGAAAVQRGRFEHSPIKPYISQLFISQDLGANKPDPAFFDLVCRTMEISDRRQAVVVGDSLPCDVAGGCQAGIDTIWYNPSRRPNPGPIQPTYTVHRLEAAGRLILQGCKP